MTIKTNNSVGLRKVLWRDGDVISENYFYLQEQRYDALIGLVNQRFRQWGLIREPLLDPTFNDFLGNIKMERMDNQRMRIDMERMQAINQQGRIMRIERPRSFSLQIPFEKRSPDSSYVLFLSPKESKPEGSVSSESEVETGVPTFDEPYAVSVSNDDMTGVPICGFVIDETKVVISKSFLPIGVFLDSSQLSEAHHSELLENLKTFTGLISKYLSSFTPDSKTQADWDFAAAALRLTTYHITELESKQGATLRFFLVLQQLVNSMRVELLILALKSSDPLKQRVTELSSALDKKIVPQGPNETNLAQYFETVHEQWKKLTDILRYLHLGVVSEKTISIGGAQLLREPPGNKLLIQFEKEETFVKGKTRLTVQLSGFSKADPIGDEMRIGLGNCIFAQLQPRDGLLRLDDGEAFSYKIECPLDVVNRSVGSQLTLYLPPPLGEGIQPLKKRITIIQRD